MKKKKSLYMDRDFELQAKIEHVYDREFRKRFNGRKTMSQVIHEILDDKKLSETDKVERIFFLGRMIGQEDVKDHLKRTDTNIRNQYR